MDVETFWEIVRGVLKLRLTMKLKCGPVDGIWFYTYALSAVDFVGNGEEFVLKMIRNKIGYEVPISVAMDFSWPYHPECGKMVNIKQFPDEPYTDVEAIG